MCSSNEASELLTHLSTTSNTVAASPCLAILPGWGRTPLVRLLPSPPPRQSYTRSIIYTERCFFHFNIRAQMAFWEESLLSPNVKSVQLFNSKGFSSAWQFFPLFSLSLHSAPLDLGWMASLSPNTLFLLATQQVSLFDHIIFIDSCDGLALHCII